MLPPGWDRRTTVFLAFALLFVISTKLAHPQVFDLDKDRMHIVELDGLWRFHTGDDPLWSDPNLDDSSWQLLHSNQTWGGQGYRGYSGMAWYRFKVKVPRDHKPLSLFVPFMTTSYELFANGKLIAAVGGMPPHPKVLNPLLHVFPVPENAIQAGGTVTVAIRVWQWPFWENQIGGGSHVAPYLGEAEVVEDEKELWQIFYFRDLTSGNFLLLINLLAGIACFVLFWSRRSDTEYLWFGASELFRVANVLRLDYVAFHDASYNYSNLLGDILSMAALLCFLQFLMVLLKGRRDILYWTAITVSLARLLVSVLLGLEWVHLPLWFAWGGWVLIYFPAYLCMLVILIRGARRGIPDARLMLAPVALCLVVYSIDLAMAGVATFGITGISFANFIWFRHPFEWPFEVTDLDVVDFLMQLSILAILMLRFVRSRRSEERMASELEAARTVQQVLIPEEIPTIPGLTLECVYKPAGQVGGDFFQIIPVASPEVPRIASPQINRLAFPEGAGAFRPLNPVAHQEGFSPGQSDRTSALIVIGDVSGKGMPAAMAVSLLVGTVRTLAHYTQSPAEILNAMNLRMLGRSKNGFTTCLVLRLDPDGSATIANAGHLSPYLGSNEVPVESGLPLGLAAEANYTESIFHLDPGGELTLITDGIAEARAKTGELFGFDRTASIAILSAQHIAATAQAFGQEDDITVLKIRRQPASEPAKVLAGV